MKKPELTRYKLVNKNDSQEIMLLHLILNGQTDNIKGTKKTVSDDGRLRKVYGIVEKGLVLDNDTLDADIQNIAVPKVCEDSKRFEQLSNSKKVLLYFPKNEEQKLVINSLKILSDVIMISKDYVITSSYVNEGDTSERGFTYFQEYVLKSHTEIGNVDNPKGKWSISFDNNRFEVKFKDVDESKPWTTLYSLSDTDKQSTYRMVLYIISHVGECIDDWKLDNFKFDTYEAKEEKENE